MVVASSNFSVPVEGIILQQPSTKLLFNDVEVGTATLYITENNVIWGGGNASNGGPSPTLSLRYPDISLHAVQREPYSALYMVVNYDVKLDNQHMGAGDEQNTNNDDDDDDFDPDDHPITQLRFIPESDNDLQAMYSAMSQGQALHPDPQDEVDDDPYMDGEDFGDDDQFEDAEDIGCPEEAAGRLQQLRIENANGNAQYEDCEDPENE